MLARLGFVASVLSEDLSTSRTCRLRNATPDRLRALTASNLEALGRVVGFLERQRILLYRISSNVIPFASHPVNTTDWWDEFGPELERIGRDLRRLGIRVSTHPGQYTVLSSPDRAVVRASIAELEYQARLLDGLGTDASSKIVVHLGGSYGGSRSAARSRFVTEARSLPAAVHRRLVVENDDRLFDAEDVLDVSTRARTPVVFDWLHHRAHPCRGPIAAVLVQVFRSWHPGDGRPKIHVSSQAPDAPAGAHAAYVDVRDLLTFLQAAPGEPFDCMLEAKQKDRALLRLRDELREAGIVEADVHPAGERQPFEPMNP
jgi:UV DNA damage endonuclease